MTSTLVDNIPPRRSRTSSADMRLRILAAAGIIFSRMSYDAVGVREIAASAGTDAAIVIRLFGSKANLFTELAESAFRDEEIFQGPLDNLGERLAHYLMQPFSAVGTNETDDFKLLLRSATSVVAAPILSSALHRALIDPLGRRIGKTDGQACAALITAQVLGFSTLRFALGSQSIETADRIFVEQTLAKAIQLCIGS